MRAEWMADIASRVRMKRFGVAEGDDDGGRERRVRSG